MTHSFTEAATLYAQNIPVVKEMEKAYKEDLRRFFELVGQSVQKGLAPSVITSVIDKGAWYSWLGSEEWSDRRVAVWSTWDQSTIMTESKVSFDVGTRSLDPGEIERYAALGRTAPLEKWFRAKKPSTWTLFRLEATWKAEEDPVEAAAAPVAAMLRVLEQTSKSA